MATALPIVSFDESGNTGPDLLHVTQPIFALASVCLKEEEAGAVLAPLLTKARGEAKFSALRRDYDLRDRLLQVLALAAQTRETVRVSLFHKPYIAVAKMVDLLMEPGFQRRGLSAQWQRDDSALRWPTTLYELAPTQLGQSWGGLMAAFVLAVRRPSPDRTTDFVDQLEACLNLGPDDRVGFPLEVMREEAEGVLGSFYNEKGRPRKHSVDPLDPAVPALIEHLDHWGQLVGTFDAHHDKSESLEKVLPYIERLCDPSLDPFDVEGLDRTARFPLKARRVLMVDSRASAGVQLADLLAGACAFQQGAFERESPDGEFAAAVADTGIRAVFQHFVAPPSFVRRSMEGVE